MIEITAESVGGDKGWTSVPFTRKEFPYAFWRRIADPHEEDVALIVGDGERVPEADVFRYQPVPVRRGFRVERSDPSYWEKVARGCEELQNACNSTREWAAAALINNCQSSTAAYRGSDGVPLASDDHPTDTLRVSNLRHIRFGPEGVEDLAVNLKCTVSHRGDADPQYPPYELFVHPAQLIRAEEICFEGESNDPNPNDANRGVGARIKRIIASPYFTNMRGYGLRRLPHRFRVREGLRLTFQKKPDGDWDRYRMIESYAFFVENWRGFAWSDGGEMAEPA